MWCDEQGLVFLQQPTNLEDEDGDGGQNFKFPGNFKRTKFQQPRFLELLPN